MYRNYNNKGLTTSLVLLIAGILFLAIPYETLKSMVFTVIGIAIILINIIPAIACIMGYSRDKSLLAPAVIYTASVVIGFIFVFYHNWIISIILAVWLIVFPIVRIIQSSNRQIQFKKELPLLIVALLLFFTPAEAVFSVVLKVFGGVMALVGLVYLITILINKKHDNNDNSSGDNNRIIIDAKVEDIE